MPLKTPNCTVCLKKSPSTFEGTEGAPGQPGSVGGMPGALQLWSPLRGEVLKDAYWGLFKGMEQEKGTAPTTSVPV